MPTVTTAPGWFAPRLSTIKYIGVSMATWPLVMGAVYLLMPQVAPIEAHVDRLLFAVQWSVLPAAVVLLILANCMRIMEKPEAENPFAGAESQAWQINQRSLQNTIEQMAFFVPALLALSIRLPAEQAWVIPLLVVTWSIGRVVFWIGYRIDPHHRSLGFSWTQNTAMLTIGWFVVTLF